MSDNKLIVAPGKPDWEEYTIMHGPMAGMKWMVSNDPSNSDYVTGQLIKWNDYLHDQQLRQGPGPHGLGPALHLE